MLQQFNISEFTSQSIRCLKIMRESYDFFKTHKLWKGIFEHKWALFITVILSVLFTYFLFSDLYDLLFSSSDMAEVDLPNEEGIVDEEVVIDEDGKSKTKKVNKKTAVSGGSKFFFLILLEIVIFHFSVKTLEILNNEKYKTSFGMFLKAEIRMIKVMIRVAIQSLIVQVILGIALYFTPIDFMLPVFMFIVHSFFIGLAFFDNYNEQQKLNIKESDMCIRHHSGAATTLGVVASIGLMIPIIGPLAVPVFGAITANIYGFRHHIENPPHHKNEEVEEIVEAEIV